MEDYLAFILNVKGSRSNLFPKHYGCSFIHSFIHFSIMCVIGRGRGGEGRNVGLIYSPPPPFFQAVPSARLCKVGDGGGGVSGGRSNPRACGEFSQ